MQRSVCVHRLHLDVFSHPKEFGLEGMESEPMLTLRAKSLIPKQISHVEYRTHDAASRRTASSTHYQRDIPAPIQYQQYIFIVKETSI